MLVYHHTSSLVLDAYRIHGHYTTYITIIWSKVETPSTPPSDKVPCRRPVQTINGGRLRRLRVRYNTINITIANGGRQTRHRHALDSGIFIFYPEHELGFYSTKRLSLFCSLGFGLTLIFLFVQPIVQPLDVSSTNFDELCFCAIDDSYAAGYSSITYENIPFVAQIVQYTRLLQ